MKIPCDLHSGLGHGIFIFDVNGPFMDICSPGKALFRVCATLIISSWTVS